MAWLRTGFDYLAAEDPTEGSKSSARGLINENAKGGMDIEKSASASEEKSARVHNRRSRDSSSLAGNPDLLTIPGVGPRNLRKLVEKGIAGLAELKRLYRHKVWENDTSVCLSSLVFSLLPIDFCRPFGM